MLSPRGWDVPAPSSPLPSPPAEQFLLLCLPCFTQLTLLEQRGPLYAQSGGGAAPTPLLAVNVRERRREKNRHAVPCHSNLNLTTQSAISRLKCNIMANCIPHERVLEDLRMFVLIAVCLLVSSGWLWVWVEPFWMYHSTLDCRG